MKKKKKNLHSVNSEPVFRADGFKRDKSEEKFPPVSHDSELDKINNSVFNEPFVEHEAGKNSFLGYIQQRRSTCPDILHAVTVLLAAVAGGLFSIPAVFLAGMVPGASMTGSGPITAGIIYVILVGPFTEEIVKQLGMIYLLEKRPWHFSSSSPFVLAGIIAGLIFATIENLVYINIYVPPGSIEHHDQFAMYRWTVCTALHVSCCILSSFGLRQVWKKITESGKPAELAGGKMWFIAAISLHGLYNLAAVVLLRDMWQ